MGTTKLSIIIPVYNIEKYLNQCLDSVINQTLRDIEIICVNDGSTDNSLQILEDYARNDERIKVINKENGGIGSARNEALKHVTGQYIGFVDSDDWVELDMYEKLYDNAQTNNCDMVMCSAHRFDDTEQKLRKDMTYFTLECFNENFDDIVFDHTQTAPFLFGINVTPWNKIYKTDLLKKHDIKFPKEDFEDNPFFYETYLNSERVSLIRENLYFYRVNRSGSFLTSGNRRFFDIIPIHNLNEEIIRKNHPEYLEHFFNVKVDTIISRYNQVDEEYKQEFLEIIKQDFLKMDQRYVDSLNGANRAVYENITNAQTPREYELYAQISHLEKTMEYKLSQQSEDYNSKIKTKDHVIKEMKSSNSWKITKPLRKIVYMLKKIKN